MRNHAAAETISKMDEVEQAKVKQGLWALIFKSLAALSLVGMIGVFFTLQSIEDERTRYLNDGLVSKALVLDSGSGDYRAVNERGKAKQEPNNFVPIVHDPETGVRYSDFGRNKTEADLPEPVRGAGTGVLQLDDAAYAAVAAEQVLVVVSTPYEPSRPWTIEKLRGFSANGYYLWMAVFGGLALCLWLVGRRFNNQ